MSSIFKNVMKSRRKRNKSRSTTPINFDATKPSDRPSNSIYPSKKHPAQPLHFIKVSSTTDEDSPRNSHYDDNYPSRRRSKSFESPLDETPSKDNKKSKYTYKKLIRNPWNRRNNNRALPSFEIANKLILYFFL